MLHLSPPSLPLFLWLSRSLFFFYLLISDALSCPPPHYITAASSLFSFHVSSIILDLSLCLVLAVPFVGAAIIVNLSPHPSSTLCLTVKPLATVSFPSDRIGCSPWLPCRAYAYQMRADLRFETGCRLIVIYPAVTARQVAKCKARDSKCRR